MNNQTEIYPYRQMSDYEFFFNTKNNVKYDIYFINRVDIPIDRLQLLYNPDLLLYEFGFDRYYVEKAENDSRILKTITNIFEIFPKENKLLFSYVFNPTGKNKELNRLYYFTIKRINLEHFTGISVYFKTSLDSYYYVLYYDDRLRIKYNQFILEIVIFLKQIFSEENILEIMLTEIATGKKLYEYNIFDNLINIYTKN